MSCHWCLSKPPLQSATNARQPVLHHCPGASRPSPAQWLTLLCYPALGRSQAGVAKMLTPREQLGLQPNTSISMGERECPLLSARCP